MKFAILKNKNVKDVDNYLLMGGIKRITEYKNEETVLILKVANEDTSYYCSRTPIV